VNEISDELHQLKGTRPTRSSVPEYQVPAAVPKPPKGMVGDAKKLFKQLAKQLAARRAATAADVHLLALYVAVHARCEKARAMVDKLGEVVTDTRLDSNGTAHEVLRKNPWCAILETCETKLHSILRDLGLTPNARTKVKATAPKPAAAPAEEFPARADQPTSEPLPDLADFEIPEVKLQ
jgi:P27 family predicted phage terminase small subunit